MCCDTTKINAYVFLLNASTSSPSIFSLRLARIDAPPSLTAEVVWKLENIFWFDDCLLLLFEFSLTGNDETQCALLDSSSSAQVGGGIITLNMNLIVVEVIRAEQEEDTNWKYCRWIIRAELLQTRPPINVTVNYGDGSGEQVAVSE